MKHLQWIRIGLASAVLLLGGIVASTSATAAPCVRECLAAGEYAEKSVVGGVTRDYIVHVPASYSGSIAVPLVLDLHGYTSDNVQQRLISGQLQQSDDRGFIVAWPQGLNRSWNAYGCCGKSLERGVDDAGFMRALVANIRRRANVDGARLHNWSFERRIDEPPYGL